jgi:hypothetical protein
MSSFFSILFSSAEFILSKSLFLDGIILGFFLITVLLGFATILFLSE